MENKAINIRKKLSEKIKNIITFFIIVIILVLIAGFTYERIGLYSDSKKYSVPGKLVKVNGHDMHIFEEGKGYSTVVFVSGWGTPSPYVDFYPLYSEISKHTKIVVYERPGYGYSEVADTSRDVDTMTKELHELLIKSGGKGPYIFVAHSLGSLEAIRFTQMYKGEVKGIITIDGGNPQCYANEEDEANPASADSLRGVLKNLGIFRVLFNHSKNFYNSVYEPRNQLSRVPIELKKIDTAMYLKTMSNKNKTDELANLKKNAKRVIENGDLGKISLRILTAEEESFNTNWKKSQDEFKAWSTDGKQRIVKGTPHYIHQYAPDEVISEILDIINK